VKKGLAIRTIWALLLLSLQAFAFAGTLTVQSPTANSYLGQSNTVRFLITGATLEAFLSGSSRRGKYERRKCAKGANVAGAKPTWRGRPLLTFRKLTQDLRA